VARRKKITDWTAIAKGSETFCQTEGRKSPPGSWRWPARFRDQKDRTTANEASKLNPDRKPVVWFLTGIMDDECAKRDSRKNAQGLGTNDQGCTLV